MEKNPDNFSPNQDKKIITPDVVEEGLQRMREEEVEKVTDAFDALRSCRDFLDQRFFKRSIMKSISIIIPTFNGQELISKYLPSVVDACNNYGGEQEIIVVDDGSDYSLAPVSAGDKKIKYIRREQNGGFSKTMNTGIKEARGEIIISLNNDVRVMPDFLEPLVKYFDDPAIFSVKPKSILPDGSNESIKGIKIDKGMVESVTNDTEGILELPYSCAGSTAYDKKKLLELGGFDEIYSPFYWEDFDLGYRAVKRGWKNIYEPQSVVYHEHGATISKITKDGPSRYFIRNREIFYWKNIHDFKLNSTALLRWPVRLVKALILGKKEISGGLAGFLKILPLVMKKRKEEKQQAKIKDKTIIDKFLSA